MLSEIYSVSEITAYIKSLIASDGILRSLMLRGEISNFKRYPSGHCYFTLKDANSQLKCVMFKSRAKYMRFAPANGLKAVVTGSIGVYERDGVYQLYVDTLTPEGKGELALAFEQIKNRLAAEGLFASDLKKPLPRYPKKIGIVTSLAGAVLRDIYHVSKRRWPQIQLILYPVQVQGSEAAGQIAGGIKFFNEKYPVDVLIVGRGGGSMEDLWSFNEEVVVRSIYLSKIPIISAVGHETDFTLADFAADVRAATPSQAAELAVPDRLELLRYIKNLQARIAGNAKNAMQQKREQLQNLLTKRTFKEPKSMLSARQEKLLQIKNKFNSGYEKQIIAKAHQLDLALERLELLNPARVLRRGYVAISQNGKMIASSKNLAIGTEIELTFNDGKAIAKVEKIAREKRKENKNA